MNILTPVVVVPILCFLFSNWLLLFGSLFIWLGEAVSSNKKIAFRLFIAADIGSFAYWVESGFNIHNVVTFYIVCFFFGFLCYQLYRTVGFGDRLSRAMIAAQGNRDADEEINAELREAIENRKKPLN